MSLARVKKFGFLFLLPALFSPQQLFALPITINFDAAQAGYTTISTNDHQEITNQFSSVGVIFSDADTAGRGAVVNGSSTSCTDASQCSESYHLYGYRDFNGSTANDVTPFISLTFVDPNNGSTPAFTDLFSIRVSNVYSNADTVLTAFDQNGATIGTDSTDLSVGNGDLLQLSGMNIFSVNIQTVLATSLTAYDDITFNEVSAVPVPAAIWLLGSALIGLFSLRKNA